jgi:hypothetical protein
MLLLYPGELYRLLGASSFSSVVLNSVGIELFVNMGYFINVLSSSSSSSL